jgi:hypothetical protein
MGRTTKTVKKRSKARKARSAAKSPAKRGRRLYGLAKPATAGARGTLAGDFAWAMRDDATAAARLKRFLKQYEPTNGEFQDAFQRSRVRAAQYELMRLAYLNGRVKEGDRLLHDLHDLGQ